MSSKNKLFLLGATLTLIGYLFGYLHKDQVSAPIATPVNEILEATGSANLERVTRIIDGDTIEIEGGVKIRYIGINAPESVAPGKPVACYGKEASDKNKELVLGRNVRLEKDVSETDKYGRLLRYVYVENVSTGSGQTSLFVNDYMVRSGYARVSTYPPDVKYQQVFLESEKKAREDALGLWSKCGY